MSGDEVSGGSGVSPTRVQVPGFLIWAELRGDGWHLVRQDGEVISGGPHESARAALWYAELVTDTSGT